MRLQTEMAVDANGKPFPVLVPDTRETIDVTLGAKVADATFKLNTVDTTLKYVIFGKTTKTYPYCSLVSTSTGTILITSKLGGADGCNISVTVATAADHTDNKPHVSVSGKDITITPDSSITNTLELVITAINGHSEASKLVTATAVGDSSHTLGTNDLQYLRGWDAGMLGTGVRCYNDGDHVCFVGTFPESHLPTPTASMPIPSKGWYDIMVGPSEKIVARGTAGEHLYLTPMRKF